MRTGLLLLALLGATAQAQQLAPAGGGSYSPGAAPCLTPTQHDTIDAMLARSIRTLARQGVLPATDGRGATQSLSWPLRQAAGFGYNSIYGISNFVDRNAAYPNQLLDWNCGTRTYDTPAGYNHSGVDIFLWPFDTNMMASGQAEIVAAAPGVIIAKADGNYDLNCAMSNASWNAVYVRNDDGSVCWYGHLKSGSLTSKAVGAAVAQGEYLGTVGSSGSSTGPHLHFEVHDAVGTVIDPYAGPCSPGASSWAVQKLYYEPTINALLTHAAPPVLAPCPGLHTPNISNQFRPGDRVYAAAYYHDQQAGQLTSYTIFRPDNSVHQAWTHSMTPAYYAASYWYWSFVLPASAPLGTWRFEATFQGQTVSHSFAVGTVASAGTARQPAAFSMFPNPARHCVTVELATPAPAGGQVLLRNHLGQLVGQLAVASRRLEVPLPPAPGVYFLTVPTATGPVTRKLLVE